MNDHKRKIDLLDLHYSNELLAFIDKTMKLTDKTIAIFKHIVRVTQITKEFFAHIDKTYLTSLITIDLKLFTNSVILGAYLHDLGKFQIPVTVLAKRGKLTSYEFSLMKQHPSYGSIALMSLPKSDHYDKDIINNIVLYHHCNLDGSGYPHGLAGDAIPLEAKIVAICDRLEAMLSKRSYKDAISLNQAILKLKTNQVDQNLLKVFDDNKYFFRKYETI